MRTTSTLSITAAALAFTVACGSASEPVAVRLVDLFQPDMVAGSPMVDPPPRTEWRFDDARPDEVDFADTGGVEAGPGVSGLDIRDGHLVGQTTSDFPLLRVERLQTLGLDDDTLIVFMSDHGEEFLEHGRMFHGQTVYNELTQVPLVMRWPGAIPSGIVVDENVQLIDIMPTLLDLSGLPHPDGLQGRSLLPFVSGGSGTSGAWTPRPAFSEKAPTSGAAAPPPGDTESYAVIDHDWLLIHNRARGDDTPEFELYDVATDPLNLTNVASGQTEVVERLARDLDRWHRIAEQARLPDDTEAAAGLSQEDLERLRSLGYIR